MQSIRTMTADEVALMRALVVWRRANGVTFNFYRARWSAPDGRSVTMNPAEAGDIWGEVGVSAGALDPHRWLKVADLSEAVDVLVAVGYLPAKFSSAYRLGWQSARLATVTPAVFFDVTVAALVPARR